MQPGSLNEVVLRMRAIVNALKMAHAAAGIPQQHGNQMRMIIIFCTYAIIFTQYNFRFIICLCFAFVNGYSPPSV
jgi:hypothetical protein